MAHGRRPRLVGIAARAQSVTSRNGSHVPCDRRLCPLGCGRDRSGGSSGDWSWAVLLRLEAWILAGNLASHRLFTQLGFTEEGILRSRYLSGGHHHDVHVLARVMGGG